MAQPRHRSAPVARHRAVPERGRRRAEKVVRPGARRARRGVLLTALLLGAVATAELATRDEGTSRAVTVQPDGVVEPLLAPEETSPVAPDAAPEPSAEPSADPSASADVEQQAPEPAVVRIPATGPGTYRAAVADARGDDAATFTYTVEVERGLPFKVAPTADTISRTLADPRSWSGVDSSLTLRRVAAGEGADLRILVSSPGTTDALCAPLDTAGRVSCRNGGLVVLNARRWAFGIPDYDGALAQYRRYLVNHEVGHFLGRGHVECAGPGEPAPVMQQQTYGLDGGARNAWPTVA